MTTYVNIQEKLLKAGFELFEYTTSRNNTTQVGHIERFESWFKYSTNTSIVVEVYYGGKAEMFAKTTKVITKLQLKKKHEKD